MSEEKFKIELPKIMLTPELIDELGKRPIPVKWRRVYKDPDGGESVMEKIDGDALLRRHLAEDSNHNNSSESNQKEKTNML